MTRYDDYKAQVTDDIRSTIEEMACQPILFVGSGLSQRYFGAPTWMALLNGLAEKCPIIDREFAYYQQTYPNPVDLGSALVEPYREWAWTTGRDEFPEELFQANIRPDAYLKFTAARYLESLTPTSLDAPELDQYRRELGLLRAIQPHALITTNYDDFLELIFPDFTPIVGQSLLRTDFASIGEIFKIHGSIHEHSDMVLCKSDYDDFINKKKYISAKLLTYFIEHPLIFVGYGVGDSNIQAILADIDEILAPQGALISNLYFVEWRPTVDENEMYPQERVLTIAENRHIRIKAIITSDFEWVFEALCTTGVMEKVNPRILRALLARMYDLVRTDVPRRSLQVDYDTIQGALEKEDGLASILGITAIEDPTAMNMAYPFTLTEVAQRLGFKTWHRANALLEQIEADSGIRIKSYDNEYHIGIQVGKTLMHKYSHQAVALLEAVRDGLEYEVTQPAG
jgi:hypothetical protein